MTDKIEELVKQECAVSSFGAVFFEEHLAVVADYTARLAEPLGADGEVVALGAWLHDLAAVRDPAAQPEHPRLGVELAPYVLAPFGTTMTSWPTSPRRSRRTRPPCSRAAPLPRRSAFPRQMP